MYGKGYYIKYKINRNQGQTCYYSICSKCPPCLLILSPARSDTVLITFYRFAGGSDPQFCHNVCSVFRILAVQDLIFYL